MTTGMLGRRLRLGLMTGAFALAVSTSLSHAARAETRGFVVSMIHTATHGNDDNCPQGGNGGPTDIRVRRLLQEHQGMSREEALKIVGNNGKNEKGERVERAKRGLLNGHEVDTGDFPTSVPDPHIQTSQGRFAYGFDLGGKRENKFEDPDTHQKIDNQMWRVLGCFQVYNIRMPVRPYNEDIAWDTAMDSMPAWLVSVTGADLSKDGEVTVTFDRALNVAMRDAHGGVLSGASYTVDTDPRSHSVLKGRIKDHVLTVEDGDMAIQGESQFYAVLRFAKTHLRLKMHDDGSMSGIIGGYQPWQDYYYYLAVRGEETGQVDLPGVYYAMKRLADGMPDASGQNTAISAAYWLEAVPAFETNRGGQVMAKAVGPGPRISGTAAIEEVGGPRK